MDEPRRRALVERAQRGEQDAFAALVDASADRLFAVAQRILRDTDLARDAVQQALLGAWRDLRTLRDPERFDAWMYRLLVHACYAEARQRRAQLGVVQPLRVPVPVSSDVTARIADSDLIEHGFRRLSPEHRTVIVLHFYLDLPLVETARIMGTPVGTARSRLHYALARLRAALEADDARTGRKDQSA